MRSLAARGFSFLKLRRLSTARVTTKKKQEFKKTEDDNSSESRPSETQQRHSEEYWSNDFEGANRVYVENHFDENYLQNRSSLLAYGKNMKRVDQTLALSCTPTPIVEPQAQELESRSWKVFRRNSAKSFRQFSWMSKIRRSPSREQGGGSRTQNYLLSN